MGYTVRCPSSVLDALAARAPFREPRPLHHDPCRAAAPGERFRYVFMLSHFCMRRDLSAERSAAACRENPWVYLNATQHAVTTLQATGARHGITVLVHRSIWSALLDASGGGGDWFARRSVALCRVDGMGSQRADMYFFSKLHVWELVQYERVAFFDSDHLFVRSPDAVFADCGDAPFCAVLGGHGALGAGQAANASRRAAPTQLGGRLEFNMGGFVVRPNASRVPELLRAWEAAPH